MTIRTPIREILAAVVAALLAGAVHAASPEESAESVVRETLDAAILVLEDSSFSDDDKIERIEQLAYARFDFRTMARLVLARNWKRFTPEQREAFISEFKRHLSLTYGKTLLNYGDEDIEYKDRRLERNGDVTVQTRIVGSSIEPVVISYRLRNREDAWGVIDVVVEGVSLVSNFRAQTQEIVSSDGPDRLIEILREKNENRATEG
jgi:phospholipid transport system substrate-binding protein